MIQKSKIYRCNKKDTNLKSNRKPKNRENLSKIVPLVAVFNISSVAGLYYSRGVREEPLLNLGPSRIPTRKMADLRVIALLVEE